MSNAYCKRRLSIRVYFLFFRNHDRRSGLVPWFEVQQPDASGSTSPSGTYGRTSLQEHPAHDTPMLGRTKREETPSGTMSERTILPVLMSDGCPKDHAAKISA